MKNISNNGEKKNTYNMNYCTVTQHEHFCCEVLVFYSQNYSTKL
jgi:hypothetical protein